MDVKFKKGWLYTGELINGSRPCQATFRFIGRHSFVLISMKPLLENYKLNEQIDYLCVSNEHVSYWDLKPISQNLENK